MKGFARLYFNKLAELSGSMGVSDEKGAAMGVEHGVEASCQLIARAGEAGRKVMFIGNGGSAAISSHMAIDFWKNGGIKATAFNDCSLLTCLGNDYDYKHVFEKPIEMFSEGGDVLFAISSSGRSENILLGVKAALMRGCAVITMSGFRPDNPLREMGAINFHVPSMMYGPVEVVHQSLCHCILDALMVEQGKLRREGFLSGG